MHDRAALGPADVTDEVLAGMVADLLGVGGVELVSSRVEEVAYDIPAITTAGRYWVRGTAAVDGSTHDFTLFVKHVHEWSRSPLFESVPEDIRSWAARLVPWRTEGAVYRSDLASRLPAGLSMPRALGVHDIDDHSYAVWLEAVPAVPVIWDLERYRHAAYLLGRFAGSRAVREVCGVGGLEWDITMYVEGRLAHQVLPILGSDDVWRHPLVKESFGDLRPRLQTVMEQVPSITSELLTFPVLAGHGDGCPNNLLVREDRDGFTMIDFGFFMGLPLGFDLGQLLVGDVQLGRHGSHDLAERDAACVEAYHEGLIAEGVEVDVGSVRRAHALHLLLFSGLSSVPFDLLDQEPTPELRAVAASRAAIGRFSLDLLDATG